MKNRNGGIEDPENTAGKTMTAAVDEEELSNAFGGVHRDLIRASLDYHHLPNICTDIFNRIFHGSSIFVAVKNEWTSQLMVERGGSKGYPYSPIMFNLCFNTLTKPQPLLGSTADR